MPSCSSTYLRKHKSLVGVFFAGELGMGVGVDRGLFVGVAATLPVKIARASEMMDENVWRTPSAPQEPPFGV